MKKTVIPRAALRDLGAVSCQTRGELLVTPWRDTIGLYYEMAGIASD
ncbi:hypothetical protein [Sphingomonas sp. OTU376]